MHNCFKVLIPVLFFIACKAQNKDDVVIQIIDEPGMVKIVDYPTPGAARLLEYLPLIKEKNVGLVVNATSHIDNTHIVDSLLSLDIRISKIFAPEHGFRSDADAGASIENETDVKTGKQIVSLYGKNKKPSSGQLEGIDIMIFDIQDVGARFYTYISTLHYVMEACAENNIPLIVLDRPNPNGFYVGGPMLESDLKSFVGMHNVPVVYGMSIGEYASMIKGEEWINDCENLNLTVVSCLGYNHNMTFELPIKPSPNLPNLQAILLYPSLCFFEGTTISIGRGTKMPFQVIGHPKLNKYNYHFTPKSGAGSKYPKHENLISFGKDLRTLDKEKLIRKQFDISYFIEFHSACKTENVQFFNDNNFFEKLSGSNSLRNEIMSGVEKDKMEARWQDDIRKFELIRNKYLLY